MFFRPEMVGRHHPAQGVRKASLWIGQKGGNARQCLFFLGIEHMKDRADQQRMGRFLPMRPTLQCAFGIDQRSEEHTSELQSLMRISYAVFCLKKKKDQKRRNLNTLHTSLARQQQ